MKLDWMFRVQFELREATHQSLDPDADFLAAQPLPQAPMGA